MAKSYSLDPKTKLGHQVLGTIFLLLTIGSITALLSTVHIIYVFWLGMFAYGTYNQFSKANKL